MLESVDGAATPSHESHDSTLADTVSLLRSENAVLGARVAVLEAQIERIVSRSELICAIILCSIGNPPGSHTRPRPDETGLLSSANAGPSEQLQRTGPEPK